MSSPSEQEQLPPTGDGAARAAEVHDSFLGVPGYADESLFAVVRYVDKVKRTIRAVDYKAFTQSLNALQQTMDSPPTHVTPAERAQKVKEQKAECMEKLAGFEELERGFDAFLVNSRSLRRQMEERK